MRGGRTPPESPAGRSRDGRREGAPASRRPSLFWLLGFFLLGVLAVASPYVYRTYFQTEEGRRKLELEVEKIKQKALEIKDRAGEYIPADLEELEALAARLEKAAGSARDEVLEELRERGLTPAELKKKVEEFRRKRKERKEDAPDDTE